MYNFQRWDSFEPLAPLQGKIDICVRGLFCTKFKFEQLLFKVFFDAMRIFAASRPKLNLLPRFCTLLFFKDGYPSSLTPLRKGGIDICTRGLFCRKFNFKQLLFKAFFDAMRCVFLAVSSPKLNLLPRFCTLLFFKDGYISSH